MFSRLFKKKKSPSNDSLDSLAYRHNLHKAINNMVSKNVPKNVSRSANYKKNMGWSDIVTPTPDTQVASTPNYFANYSPEPTFTNTSYSTETTEPSVVDDYSKYLQQLYATDYNAMVLNRELEDYTNWNQVDWRYDPVADTINKYGKK